MHALHVAVVWLISVPGIAFNVQVALVGSPSIFRVVVVLFGRKASKYPDYSLQDVISTSAAAQCL